MAHNLQLAAAAPNPGGPLGPRQKELFKSMRRLSPMARALEVLALALKGECTVTLHVSYNSRAQEVPEEITIDNSILVDPPDEPDPAP